MNYTATFSSDDMTIVYTATGTDSYRADCVEITGVNVECLEILGCDVEFDKLPDKLQSNILELSNEVDFEPM